jgi:succinate dehydrogenase/fumarate reductase flavoprotein subunit
MANLYAIGEITGGYRINYVGGDSLSHSGISGMLLGANLAKGE